MFQDKNLLRNVVIFFLLIPLIHSLVLIGFQDDILLGRILLGIFAMIIILPYAKSTTELVGTMAEFKMKELEERLRFRLKNEK